MNKEKQNPTPATGAGESATPEAEHPGWIMWCKEGECFYCEDEAAVRECVVRSVFGPNAKLSEEHKDECKKIADILLADGTVDFEGDPNLNLIRADADEIIERLEAERNAAILRAEAAEREVAQTSLNWRREIEAVNSLAHLVENQDRELKSAQADLAKAREEVAELRRKLTRECEAHDFTRRDLDAAKTQL